MAVKLHEIYWLIVQRHICGNLGTPTTVLACLRPAAVSAYVVQLVFILSLLSFAHHLASQ